MNLNSRLFPTNAFRFSSGGGGGGGTPVLAAPPAPVASTTSTEVTQAKLEAKRLAKNKQGIGSTILAGNGQFNEKQNPGFAGSNTLLGGGS